MLIKDKCDLNHYIKQKRFMLFQDFSVLSQYNQTSSFKKIKQQKSCVNLKNKQNNEKLKSVTIKNLNSFLSIDNYSFFENYQRFKYKQIDTYFRNIISDQKKRASFAKEELRKAILKTLLSANPQSTLFICKSLSTEMRTLKSLPLIFQKTKLGNISQHWLKEANIKSLLKTKKISKQNISPSIKSSTKGYVKLGPSLFLDKKINSLFTEKVKSFSRIQNRCLLSGRSSIIGKYRLSRINFRHYINQGLIPGLTKNRK